MSFAGFGGFGDGFIGSDGAFGVAGDEQAVPADPGAFE
jgi:hypothetical protein